MNFSLIYFLKIRSHLIINSRETEYSHDRISGTILKIAFMDHFTADKTYHDVMLNVNNQVQNHASNASAYSKHKHKQTFWHNQETGKNQTPIFLTISLK